MKLHWWFAKGSAHLNSRKNHFLAREPYNFATALFSFCRFLHVHRARKKISTTGRDVARGVPRVPGHPPLDIGYTTFLERSRLLSNSLMTHRNERPFSKLLSKQRQSIVNVEHWKNSLKLDGCRSTRQFSFFDSYSHPLWCHLNIWAIARTAKRPLSLEATWSPYQTSISRFLL